MKTKILCTTVNNQELSYTKSLMSMVAVMKVAQEQGIETKFINVENATIPRMRNIVADELLKSKEYTHLLSLDSDMIFHTQTIPQLLSRDCDIVSGAYCSRQGRPLLFSRLPNTLKTDYQYYIKNPQTWQELTECDATGMGCCLIKREVFEKLSKPYFEWTTNSMGEAVGEDIYFFNKCQEKGYKIFVDFKCPAAHLTSQIIPSPIYESRIKLVGKC